MIIRRHDRDAEWLDFPDWPALVDTPLTEAEPRWLGRLADTEGPFVIWVEANGIPTEGAPASRYLVELGEKDLGEILLQMPVGAVGAVLDRLLRAGDPEVIGAIVGRIVAHLARGAAGPGNPWRG